MALQAEEKKRFEQIAKELRLTIIDVMAWSGGAHVGGSLSIVEILTLLYFKYLNIDPKNPKWEDRDRFILSKGHTAAGYIPVLAKRGYFDEDLLKSFNHFGTPLRHAPGLQQSHWLRRLCRQSWPWPQHGGRSGTRRKAAEKALEDGMSHGRRRMLRGQCMGGRDERRPLQAG